VSRLILVMMDRVVTAERRLDGWRVATHLQQRAPRGVATAGDVVLCATRDAGVWRSTDAGASWARSAVLPTEAEVTAVAAWADRDVDGGNRVVAYCGTEPTALWRSDDHGDTWRELAPLTALPSAPEWSFPPRPDSHHVRWIAVDPGLADRLYVCVEAGALVRSVDGGESWIDRVRGGPVDTHTLATHPRDHGRLYAAAGDGYFESRDHGDTWERPREGLRHGYLWSVVAHRSEPELRLVSAAHGPRQAHDAERAESCVYRRSRLSEWEPCASGLPEAEGTTVSVLANDPHDADRVWLANNRGIFSSNDFGESWVAERVPLPPELAAQRVNGLLVL
jgi:photosystem II stability/assembly factor-like uncharacterized protein